ncbi:STAS/SEC14 domain-containing protein [Adhaeribacter sp. BT258]|uniref:STAS/SEC14 domain-containing protein n=1 Tax=Adhaeribacter terrigena TaxID=2793070 RepID=A0ABS1C3V7_9BACT|nr:STAS/SEC14 domain-containing protein [Adhaeribacter terrigena]MBK0404040.1 STAS/SEC14 domain-containing protein [Adhaeribacter terrigena]
MQSTLVVCFENECCTLEHDTDNQCLVMTWKGLLPSKGFREVHQHALHLMRKHKISKLLCDARRMKTIGSEDAAWIENFWIPSAVVAGYRYCAIVESDYIFNQISINNITEKIDPESITIGHFKTREEALHWLRHS